MRNNIIIFLLLLLAQDYIGQDLLSRKDKRKFKKAIKLGDKGERGKAIDFLTELIIDNSKESILYSKRGLYYYSNLEFKRALDDFNEGLARDYSNYEAFMLRWYCYYSLDMNKEALIDLKILIRSDKENDSYHYYIAGCYEELEKFQLAVSHLDTALFYQNSDSDLEEYYLHRGYSRSQLQNYEGAIADFSKALTYNDTNYFVLTNRSSCYRYLNELDKATEDIMLIVKNDSLNFKAYHELAIIEAIKEHHEKSIFFDKKVIALDSSYHEAYLNLSRVYLMLKKYDESEKALDACPMNTKYLSQYYLNYSLLYKEQGDSSKAFEYLKKGLNSEAEPYDSSVLNNFGFEFEELGHSKLALKAYNKSIGLNVNYTYSYNNRANVKFKLGDVEGACRDWNKALEKGYVYNPDWKEEYGIENPKDLIEKHCTNKN